MIGYIYKIEGGGKFYIGSTTQGLAKRIKNHRSKSKEPSRKNTPLYKLANEIGWDNMKIILLQEIIFINKSELMAVEDKLIRGFLNNDECLNHNRVTITKKEKNDMDKLYSKKRRNERPEYERNRLNEWRRKNPDMVKEQTKRHNEKKKLVNNKNEL